MSWQAVGILTLALSTFFSAIGYAEDCKTLSRPTSLDAARRTTVTNPERNTLRDLVHDQKCIWTSPLQLGRDRNWAGFIPWAGATSALIVTDPDVLHELPTTPSAVNRARHVSDAGVFGILGASGTMYLLGLSKSNPRLKETGWLAGEAVADGMAINLVTQQVTRRNRPVAPVDSGEWFKSGVAFPSDHAMASWAAATVIAHEYPGWFTKTLAYGTASAVSVSRLMSRQHSASDIFVGSSFGYLIGRYVYRSRHPEEFTTDKSSLSEGLSSLKLRPAKSPFLPLDSIYYPMLDRLITSGYIDSAIVGIRPWTRVEVARMIDEASNNAGADTSEDIRDTIRTLQREFDDSNPVLPVEEVYSRVTGISGTPLRDSYHFGQTLYNDYGRPYWTGANGYMGASGAVAMGPITFYGRGEYQYSPGGPTYSATTQETIRNIDGTPTPLLGNNAETSQFRLIEAYASAPVKNLTLSFGKQAMWWGTGWNSAMLASDNSEPIYAFRIAQTSPVRLPWIFSFLGLVRVEGFLGKFSGHLYPRDPYVHGQKITFKPTKNLELGFSRTVIFAGNGHPLTLHSFWRSFVSVGDNPAAAPGSSNDVGDRRGGFDFAYRLPGLRDWITVYGDFFTEDDPSPLNSIKRAAWNPGIALSHVPGIKKLDLRVEAPTSAPPFPAPTDTNPYGGHFFYYNGAYLDGYTNKGNIYGNWIGRQAKGISATSRYWFSPTNVLEVGYRQSTLDPKFIPAGGNYTDVRVGYRRSITQQLSVEGFVQGERWNVPLMSVSPQRNTAVSLRVAWHLAHEK